MVGTFFAVVSTVSFGFHNAAMRRGVLGAAAVQALYVTVILGVPVLLVAAALSGELERAASISPKGYALLAAAGLVHFLFGRYCNYRAVSAIGSNRSGPFMGTSLLYSVGIAVLFQGETVSGPGMVGVGLMFVAPLLMIRGPVRRTPAGHGALRAGTPLSGPAAASTGVDPTTPTRARLIEGYLFAIGSAIGYGSSPNLIKAGLEDTGMGVFGGLVSYTAASLVLIATFVIPGRLGSILQIPKVSLNWFLLAAFSISFAQMFRYVALSTAPVAVVASLGQLSPMFSLMFGFILNREVESFAPRVLIGIVLSVAGSLIVILGH